VPNSRDDWAVLIGNFDADGDFIEATDVHAHLLQACG
jgi:hypothetical protein